MKLKIFAILTMCLIATSVIAQKSINNYKYVLVPNKYDFLKEKDQYQLNSLTRFLFEKYGFEAIMEGEEYPEDLNFNRCLAMTSDVIKESGVFATKLKVILKDCNEKQIFESAIGDSREKDYKISYNMALREAFKSFETVYYAYKPDDEIEALGGTLVVAKSESEEIKQLKQQIEELETAKDTPEVDKNTESVPVAAIPVTAVAVTPAVNEVSNADTIEEGGKKGLESVLYAQETKNGYQLVDSTPKVVFKVKKTHFDNVFLVEGKSAIVFKKGDDWVVEYYENNVLKQQILNIKF